MDINICWANIDMASRDKQNSSACNLFNKGNKYCSLIYFLEVYL